MVVRAQCKHEVHFALLPDGARAEAPSKRWFDCKTGTNWRKNILRKARSLRDDGTAGPALAGLLAHLRNGGELWVVLNVPGAQATELADELSKVLAGHLGEASTKIRNQLRVVDARDLVSLAAELEFVPSVALASKLGVVRPAFLRDWTAWTREFTEERARLNFEDDDRRRGLAAEMSTVVDAPDEQDADARTFWLVGAPGTGKTRLIHHFLDGRGESVVARVAYTDNARETFQWLSGDGVLAANTILVVDEVTSEHAPLLAMHFRRQPAGCRLFLIGPAEAEPGAPDPSMLTELAPEASRRLVEAQAGDVADPTAREALVATVIDLSRGYPLFALWLSQGLVADPSALREPRTRLTGTLKLSEWSAASLVLAGDVESQQRRARAELRGKVLLMVMIEPRTAWNDLELPAREGFATSFDVAWADLQDAAREVGGDLRPGQ